MKRWLSLLVLLPLTACGYNRIQTLDEQANTAQSQIEVQLQRRADLIPNLVSTVKGYAQHEEDVFTKVAEQVPFITRTLAPFEVLSEEGLATIEQNADSILERVGIDFRDSPDATKLLAEAGCDIDCDRVRFPRGAARTCRCRR